MRRSDGECGNWKKHPASGRKNKDGKSGRPRVEESVNDAIIRIRKETGWGYTKIVQALRRLGHQVSRQTVKNVIVAAGLGPQPNDHPNTWSDFLRRHAGTLWQCDFACKKKWTVKGLVDVYFLVFIHLGTPHLDFTMHRASNRRLDDAASSQLLDAHRGRGCALYDPVPR